MRDKKLGTKMYIIILVSYRTCKYIKWERNLRFRDKYKKEKLKYMKFKYYTKYL